MVINMWQVEKSITFPAAHFLYGVQGLDSEVHGHNFVVSVKICGERLVRSGVIIEGRDIDRMFRNVIGSFISSLINRTAPFDSVSPTLENLSRYIFEGFDECLKSFSGISVSSVSVSDGEEKVTYILVDK